MKKLFSLLLVALSLVAFSHSAYAVDTPANNHVRVTTTDGIVLELEPRTDSAGQTTYVVVAVFASVTDPVKGAVEIPVTSSSLKGASVAILTSTSGAATVTTIAVTPQGSTTPYTNSQLATTLQPEVNTAVQQAITNNVVSANTPAPTVTAPGFQTVAVVAPPAPPAAANPPPPITENPAPSKSPN